MTEILSLKKDFQSTRILMAGDFSIFQETWMTRRNPKLISEKTNKNKRHIIVK